MVIPEIILHRVIVNGLRSLRKDPRVLDSMFRNLDQASLYALKEFILKAPIALSINYPKKAEVQVPAIIMLMKNEGEPGNGGFLGDQLGTSPHYGVPDEEISYDTDSDGVVLGGGSSSGLSGLPKLLLQPVRVSEERVTPDLDGTQIVIHEDDRSMILDFVDNMTTIPQMDLYVVRGAGFGQVLPILRITTESLDVDGTLSVHLDDTSVVVLRAARTHGSLGEPSRVYDSTPRKLTQRLGALYDTTYQLTVLGAEAEQALYLYAVVKAIFFMSRVFLEEQGLQVLKISGSDLTPRSENIPDTIYQRVMYLQFTYPFHITVEADVFASIELGLDPRDPFSHTYSTTLTSTIVLDGSEEPDDE